MHLMHSCAKIFIEPHLGSMNACSPRELPLILCYIINHYPHPTPTGDIYYKKPGQVISGAITLAVDEVNADPDVLPNHTVEFLIAETLGQETESIKLTSELAMEDISAFVGPQETCVHEGRIAAAFNIPMVSYVSKFYFSLGMEYRLFSTNIQYSCLSQYPM